MTPEQRANNVLCLLEAGRLQNASELPEGMETLFTALAPELRTLGFEGWPPVLGPVWVLHVMAWASYHLTPENWHRLVGLVAKSVPDWAALDANAWERVRCGLAADVVLPIAEHSAGPSAKAVRGVSTILRRIADGYEVGADEVERVASVARNAAKHAHAEVNQVPKPASSWTVRQKIQYRADRALWSAALFAATSAEEAIRHPSGSGWAQWAVAAAAAAAERVVGYCAPSGEWWYATHALFCADIAFGLLDIAAEIGGRPPLQVWPRAD